MPAPTHTHTHTHTHTSPHVTVHTHHSTYAPLITPPQAIGSGGTISKAFHDMTGMPCTKTRLNDENGSLTEDVVSGTLWKRMVDAQEKGCGERREQEKRQKEEKGERREKREKRESSGI